MNYSVLMSVYKSEKAENLRLAMDSMWCQTVPTDDFVLMCDGPLTKELDAVIHEMEQEHKPTLRVIRLNENHGLGYALREGIIACKNELIARMDSDDISRADRCEKEMSILLSNPNISICGSVIEEFSEIKEGMDYPAKINAKRVVPERAEDIISFAKFRNPFNHPSVIYRKSDVLAAGNYQDIRYLQDYYLWTHMLIAGYQGYNIQDPLVYMRADNNLFKRRSGKLYRDIQLNLFRYMKENGFINEPQYLISCILRVGSSFAPNWLRKMAFRKILRKL